MKVSNCCNGGVKGDEGLQIDPNVQLGMCSECGEHCEVVEEGWDENITYNYQPHNMFNI